MEYINVYIYIWMFFKIPILLSISLYCHYPFVSLNIDFEKIGGILIAGLKQLLLVLLLTSQLARTGICFIILLLGVPLLELA